MNTNYGYSWRTALRQNKTLIFYRRSNPTALPGNATNTTDQNRINTDVGQIPNIINNVYDPTFAAADDYGSGAGVVSMTVTYEPVSGGGPNDILYILTFSSPVGFITNIAYISSIGSGNIAGIGATQLPQTGVSTVHTFPGLNPNGTASNLTYTLTATIDGLDYSGSVTFPPAENTPAPQPEE